ncbi:hypothetical protein TNCV_4409361 [Trichonephila clavipes]|nr:hypothetical protein TNCV_4409361 [Trichonephila clavipes]
MPQQSRRSAGEAGTEIGQDSKLRTSGEKEGFAKSNSFLFFGGNEFPKGFKTVELGLERSQPLPDSSHQLLRSQAHPYVMVSTEEYLFPLTKPT